MDVQECLDDFPMREKVDYLNAASIGLVPDPVIKRSKEIFVDLAEGGTATLDEEKEELVYNSLREESANLLGCSPEDIAIFNSTSEALNCIAWSLELKSGNIVSTGIEFPSVTYPWMRIAKNKKIDVKLVEADNWCIPSDTLLHEIDKDTEVVALSHVEYLTGQKFDMKKIAKRAHEVGAIVVVDGVQAAGYLPLDMGKMGVDVYITGSYKWLLAPFGAAVAYISKDLYDGLDPAFVGWRSTETMWNFDATTLTYASTARKFEYSTSAYDVKLALAEAIKYLRKIGIDAIYRHNTALIETLRDEISSIEGAEIITPGMEGSRLTFTVEGKNSAEINKTLRSLSRSVELSIRSDMIRISPHIYNTEEDILYAVDSLKEILGV